MEYTELITCRYSCRAYRPDPVEPEKLTRILEAARLAPTAHNNQPFQIVVAHTDGRQETLGKIYPRDWFVQAPLLICMVSTPRSAWVRRDDQRRYQDVDAAIAMDHLILEATNQGLGTCWIAAFNARAARQALELPDEVEPVLFTPLGYPAIGPHEKTRKPLDELVRWEHW